MKNETIHPSEQNLMDFLLSENLQINKIIYNRKKGRIVIVSDSEENDRWRKLKKQMASC